jgi:hypothetical protein
VSTLVTSFVLGYHGCDRAVAEKVLAGEPFAKSENAYDWLGHGVYFWESNPRRGLAFATEKAAGLRGRLNVIKEPFVIGAVIDLRLCLNLTEQSDIEQVRSAHKQLRDVHDAANRNFPNNTGDGLRRPLDCAVIQALHGIRRRNGAPEISTVRGIFVEGDPIYETSGFLEKTHVQICVRDPDCIKGVFRVPKTHLE